MSPCRRNGRSGRGAGPSTGGPRSRTGRGRRAAGCRRLARRDHDLGRDPGGREGAGRLDGRPLRRPRRHVLVDHVVLRTPARGAAQLGGLGPRWRPERPHQRLPLCVGLDGHGDPRIGPGTRIDALGRPSGPRLPMRPSTGPPAPCSTSASAATLSADSTMTDSTSIPSPLRCRASSASRVANTACVRPPGHTRRARAWEVVGEPGAPGQAAHRLHGLGETGAVTPRAVEPEGGHAHHDQARGCALVQRGEVQAELVHDPGGEVLDQHVSGVGQAPEQRRGPRRTQIEGDVAFGQVGGVEDGAPFPPRLVGRALDAAQSHLVGPGRRLDLDHLGAQGGQDVGGRRSGPPGREVDHPNAAQGQPRRRRRAGPAPRAPARTGRRRRRRCRGPG